MEKPIKIAIAGSGYGRKVALPVYAELEEFEPVAVWSRRPERAQELAEEAGVGLGTADFDELIYARPVKQRLAVLATVWPRCDVARAELSDSSCRCAGRCYTAGRCQTGHRRTAAIVVVIPAAGQGSMRGRGRRDTFRAG